MSEQKKTVSEILKEARERNPNRLACSYGVHVWEFGSPSEDQKECLECEAVYEMREIEKKYGKLAQEGRKYDV